ncbi:MAG: hypothetical protein JW850_19845 [Thermoflexales bacterium]|nr:hypothetical protein [Thermoflexales bacterium]
MRRAVDAMQHYTWRSGLALVVASLAAAAVAAAFYAPTLRFGFFNDDPSGHFAWMTGRSAWSFFLDAGGHGYYRPLSFALWQVLHDWLGRHDPFVLHSLNVLTHAANAALVCCLGYRLSRSPDLDTKRPIWYGLVAGLLFALYPFSYEAVPYVGSFVHPLVTFFILLTLLFYLAWRAGESQRGGWGWFLAAHAALTLAVLTHENGIIIPLLILAMEGFQVSGFTSCRQALPRLSFFIEPALFAFIWLLVPKASGAIRALSPSAAANGLPFLQALVYPVAPLAGRDLTRLVLVALVALAGLAWLAHKLRQLRLAAFGLLVWGLASLPAILLLDQAYVTGSPRLFYLGSVGAALLWAMGGQVSGFRFQVFLIACYLAPFVLWLWPYTTCQLRYQGYGGEVGRMMAGATRQAGGGQVTFVNLPYFFGSRGPGTACPRPFALAPTGVVVIPPYADARDFALYNGGLDLPTRAVRVDEYVPGWAVHGEEAGASGLRQALVTSHVFVFDLVGWQLHDLSSRWQLDAPQPGAPPVAALGSAIQLERFDLACLDSHVVVSLTWRAAAAPGQDYTVFTQLLDASGQLVAQHDGPPAEGLAPTRLWQAGDRVVDVHTIAAPDGAADTLRLIAGMYDPATGMRLEALRPDGVRLAGDAVPLGNGVPLPFK